MGNTTFTPLQENLLVLSSIKNQLTAALSALDTSPNTDNDDLKFTVSNHLIILVCSFLSEWENFTGRGKDNNEVKITLKIASPALKRIQIWKGLKKLRSKILAHGYREKNGEAVWPWEVFASYEIPTAYAEIIVLASCSIKAIDIAVSKHIKEYLAAAGIMEQVDTEIADKGVLTVEEIESALEVVGANMVRVAGDFGLKILTVKGTIGNIELMDAS